ncbi:hypothetical protein EV192_101234 [Actinocrispum wychmicini]|uniref:Small secreted domain DUF320 n=1 Tax=Actinocrispum wychmicini TaxID=1213861 RepID=A0A4R2K3V1_9PSEU|nr:hypothetical protein EV192_101234 [Actinocrispum wychmicini]
MKLFKKAVVVAALAAAGFAGVAGTAFAGERPDHGHGRSTDGNINQTGVVPVHALNNVNVSPNFGCLANRPLEDLNAQSLVGLVPVAVDVDEALKQPHINVLSNGNVSTNVNDDSCTSNQGSSQAGSNTHGAKGAGDNVNVHKVGDSAGSHNASGNGAGGLIGSTGVLGNGLGLGKTK